MNDFAIELKNVSKKYDGFSLRDVNLTLPRGCIMGLIGENGAGKSTTIKLLLGLIRADGGSASVLGCGSSALSNEIKEKIGVVFDESSFPENLKVREIEKVLGAIYRNWDAQSFRKYKAAFGLPDDKAVKSFSRGMKMKLSIAVAFSHHAELLVLDEATSGLDPVVRDEILDALLDFIQDERHSVLISSHITGDLEKVCDYITFISDGRIVLSEEKDRLLSEYVVVKCGPDETDALPQDRIIGMRRGRFQAETLMKWEDVPRGFSIEPAGLEEIMLFHVKGKTDLEERK